jgi:predicted esterase
MARTRLVWLAVVVLCGCDQDSGSIYDTSTDTLADSAVDSGDDVVVDSGTDVAPDTALDTAVDVPPDTAGYDGEPGDFTETYLGRQYRMHVPAAYSHATPIDVVVGFHGAGDTGANFYNTSQFAGWVSAADAAPFILIVPDTKSPYRDFAVWSGDPREDFDEMSVEMGEIIGLVEDVGTHYNTADLYAYGFSDGGLFLGVTGFEYADDLAGLVITGYGWGTGYLNTPSWLIPVFMTCGQSDSFYAYANDTQAYLASQGHPLEWVPVPGVGHQFTSLMSTSPPGTIYDWLESH